jgi:hypothetical protein
LRIKPLIKQYIEGNNPSIVVLGAPTTERTQIVAKNFMETHHFAMKSNLKKAARTIATSMSELPRSKSVNPNLSSSQNHLNSFHNQHTTSVLPPMKLKIKKESRKTNT